MRACRVTRDNRVTELDVFILLTIGSYGPAAGLWQASNVLEAPVHRTNRGFFFERRPSSQHLAYSHSLDAWRLIVLLLDVMTPSTASPEAPVLPPRGFSFGVV